MIGYQFPHKLLKLNKRYKCTFALKKLLNKNSQQFDNIDVANYWKYVIVDNTFQVTNKHGQNIM